MPSVREARRVLFITLSNVGDAIMSTTVLEALRSHCPRAVIDLVADRRSSRLFSQCPYRGVIYHKDKRKFLRGAPALLWQTRRVRYDLIVDIRTDGLSYLMKGRRRLTKWGGEPYGEHAVEEMMGVIRRLHGHKPLPPTRVWYGEEERDYARRALAGLDATRLLVIAPGSREEAKRWGGDNFAAFANALSKRFTAAALLGVASERGLTAAVAARLCLPCVDLAGGNDLLQAAALCERARLFIGNDSGLGHVAVAAGAPALILFGPHRPERVRPWGENVLCLAAADRRVERIPVSEAVTRVRAAGLV